MYDVTGKRNADEFLGVSQAGGLRSTADVREIDFREVGRQAFAAGQPCAPALNAEVMAAVDGMSVGTGAADIMRKFAAGWCEASASSTHP
jgi:hypothetical protein